MTAENEIKLITCTEKLCTMVEKLTAAILVMEARLAEVERREQARHLWAGPG